MTTPTQPIPGRLVTAQAVQDYILGDATRDSAKWTRKSVTLRSIASGAHFTYRVARPAGKGEERPWLVSILTGPDNTSDYVYLGLLRVDAAGVILQHTTKSGLPTTAPAWKAWDFLTRAVLQRGRMPAALEVFHEGRCGRCGRKLTTPESVALGLGPECATKIGT